MANKFTNSLNNGVHLKNQFGKFSGYQLAMIQSFAVNAIMSSRTNDRYEAIVDATLNMIEITGFKLEPQLPDLKSKILKKLGRYNVYTLQGEPSKDVVDNIMSFIYEMDVVIIKDEKKEVMFHEVQSPEAISEPKKAWVM